MPDDYFNLTPGDRWGAYWLHPDGWFRLYAPTATALAEAFSPDI